MGEVARINPYWLKAAQAKRPTEQQLQAHCLVRRKWTRPLHISAVAFVHRFGARPDSHVISMCV